MSYSPDPKADEPIRLVPTVPMGTKTWHGKSQKSNHQSEVMAWTLRRGAGAVRTGLEDNIRIGKDATCR